MTDDVKGMATCELGDILRGLTEQLTEQGSQRTQLERQTLTQLRVRIVGELAERAAAAERDTAAIQLNKRRGEVERQVAYLESVIRDDETSETLRKIHSERVAELRRSVGDAPPAMGD